MPDFDLVETPYGFMWGPIMVTRIISDKKFGVILGLKSKHNTVEIRITPKGTIKIHKWKEE